MTRLVPIAASLTVAVAFCGTAAVAQDSIPMAAKALAQEFTKDRAAAIQKYSGKTVLLKGTIGRINLNQFGTATMILDGQYTSDGLGVWLKPDQDARTVAVGQTVTVRCDVQKNNDVVQDCVFVR
jgi:hypothetical protein